MKAAALLLTVSLLATAHAFAPLPSLPTQSASSLHRPFCPRPLESSRSRNWAPVSTQDSTTHYQALGLTQGASDGQIRTAYLKLAKQLHPDVTGGDKAKVARFQRVTAAYEELSDMQRRAAYDMALAQRGARATGNSLQYRYDLGRRYEEDDAPPSQFFVGALFMGIAGTYKAVWSSIMGGNQKMRQRRERRRRRRG